MLVTLLLLFLWASRACTESHTLRYYYTVISNKGSGLPEFSVVAFVDDWEVLHYNSETHLAQPVSQWMKKNERLEYWDRMTETFRAHESVLIHDMRATLTRFNQTTGFHSYQKMYGCELREDGSIVGFSFYGYDGRDFAYLDTQKWVYTPIIEHAQFLTQAWNSMGVRRGEVVKKYMENICIKDLKEFLEYGREDLEKRVCPEVKVWSRHLDGITRLHCLVYGFHPRAVEVKWVRNGVDIMPLLEAKTILPNPDGTYQTRVSTEISAREDESYSCHVDHSSLDKILRIKWEPDNGLSVYYIVGVTTGFLAVLIIAVLVIGRVRKMKQPYKITSTSETGCDSSNSAET